MKHFAALVALGCAVLFTAHPAHGQSVPQALNFQGRLAKPDGTSVPDTNTQSITLRLFDAADGGNLLWEQTIDNLAIHNGTFATRLDFSANYQNNNTSMSVFANPLFTPYLEIQVGIDTPLTPRQPFASVAYALVANTAMHVPDGSIMDSNIVSVDWSKIINVPAGMGGNWTLNGNAGTDPNTNFLGTTDAQPLVFKVNEHQAIRYTYAENTATIKSEYRSINVLGGSEINSITAGVVGATIAGGGLDYFSKNRLSQPCYGGLRHSGGRRGEYRQ